MRDSRHQDARSLDRREPTAVHAAAAAASADAGAKSPGLLNVASPNKTWVGVGGAIVLGTITAVSLEGVLDRLCRAGLLSPAGSGSQEQCGLFFSLGGVTGGWLGLAGVGLCAVGVVGDLWESLLKRAAMVKVGMTVSRS